MGLTLLSLTFFSLVHSFIHSFHKYLLCNYYVVGIVLDTGINGEWDRQAPFSWSIWFGGGDRYNMPRSYNGMISSLTREWQRDFRQGTAEIKIQRSESMANSGNWKCLHSWSTECLSSHWQKLCRIRADLKILTASAWFPSWTTSRVPHCYASLTGRDLLPPTIVQQLSKPRPSLHRA